MPEYKKVELLAETSQWDQVELAIEHFRKTNPRYNPLANIKHGPFKGTNLLWFAARDGRWDKELKTLITPDYHNFDASPLDTDNKDCNTTILWYACRDAQKKFVYSILPAIRRFVDKSPYHPDNIYQGVTPLWWAVKNQQWTLVRKLIGKGARSFDKGPTHKQHPEFGVTPLWLLAKAKQWDLVELVLELGASHIGAHPTNFEAKQPQCVLDLMLADVPDAIPSLCTLQRSKSFNYIAPERQQAISEATGPHLRMQNIIRLAHAERWSEVQILMKDFQSYSQNHAKVDYDAVFLDFKHQGITLLWCAAKSKKWILFKKFLQGQAKFWGAKPTDSDHEYADANVFWWCCYNNFKFDWPTAIIGDEAWEVIRNVFEHSPSNDNSKLFHIPPSWLLAFNKRWSILDKLISLSLKSFDFGPEHKDHQYYGTTTLWMVALGKQWDLFDKMVKITADSFKAYPRNESKEQQKNCVDLMIDDNQLKLLHQYYYHDRFKDFADSELQPVKDKIHIVNEAFHPFCKTKHYNETTGRSLKSYTAQGLVRIFKSKDAGLFQDWDDQEILNGIADYYEFDYYPNECKRIATDIFDKVIQTKRAKGGLNGSHLLFMPSFIAAIKAEFERALQQAQTAKQLPKALPEETADKLAAELIRSDLSQQGIATAINAVAIRQAPPTPAKVLPAKPTEDKAKATDTPTVTVDQKRHTTPEAKPTPANPPAAKVTGAPPNSSNPRPRYAARMFNFL